jgi:hypothetical protein
MGIRVPFIHGFPWQISGLEDICDNISVWFIILNDNDINKFFQGKLSICFKESQHPGLPAI